MGSFLSSLLSNLGFIRKSMKIIVIGLDNAGKTTLLGRLKNGLVYSTLPTDSAAIEEFYSYGINFQAWDLGGHKVRYIQI